jgi:hypothetical protein
MILIKSAGKYGRFLFIPRYIPIMKYEMITPGVKHTCSLSGIALMILLFSGCSIMRVNCDYDTATDFNAFKTYRITPAIEIIEMDPIYRQILTSAIASELENRNYQKTNSLTPDIWVEVFLKTNTTENTTQTGDRTMGMNPYRYGSNFTTDEVNYHTYDEGVLFIEVVNGATNEIVWEGRIMAKIQQGRTEEKVEKRISKAIKKVFNKYPVAI